MMRKARGSRGAIFILVIVLTIVLAIFGVVLLQLSLCMCGAKEVRNATDSGALNVAKQVISLKVNATTPDENEFMDVADDRGQFGLANINRVWGEALLAAINVESMKSQGQSTALAEQHTTMLYNAAQSLSDRLRARLVDEKNLRDFFEDFSSVNSARMLGTSAHVTANQHERWQTSYVNKGEESNIKFSFDQLPAGFDRSRLQSISADGDSAYFPGYTEINVLDHKFAFVPFQQSNRPHLISRNTFSAGASNTAADSTPPVAIPNAFSAAGAAQSANSVNLGAVSFALANSRKTFELRKPHGFVKIQIQAPKVIFTINGNEEVQTYDVCPPSEKISSPHPAGRGNLTVQASVGNEYLPSTLERAVFNLPAVNYDLVTSSIVQRMKQVDPDFTKSRLIQLLRNQELLPGELEYFLLTNEDSGEIIIAPRSRLVSVWLNPAATADGLPGTVASELAENKPNEQKASLSGNGIIQYGPLKSVLVGELAWIPGSGFGGCLGELSIERNTRVSSSGTVF